jgi:hypothetical protein
MKEILRGLLDHTLDRSSTIELLLIREMNTLLDRYVSYWSDKCDISSNEYNAEPIVDGSYTKYPLEQWEMIISNNLQNRLEVFFTTLDIEVINPDKLDLVKCTVGIEERTFKLSGLTELKLRYKDEEEYNLNK